MKPFPAEPMRMWPISTRVNKPENDTRRSSSQSSYLLRRFKCLVKRRRARSCAKPRGTNRRLPSLSSSWNGCGNIGSQSDRCGLARSHSVTSRVIVTIASDLTLAVSTVGHRCGLPSCDPRFCRRPSCQARERRLRLRRGRRKRSPKRTRPFLLRRRQ